MEEEFNVTVHDSSVALQEVCVLYVKMISKRTQIRSSCKVPAVPKPAADGGFYCRKHKYIPQARKETNLKCRSEVLGSLGLPDAPHVGLHLKKRRPEAFEARRCEYPFSHGEWAPCQTAALARPAGDGKFYCKYHKYIPQAQKVKNLERRACRELTLSGSTKAPKLFFRPDTALQFHLETAESLKCLVSTYREVLSAAEIPEACGNLVQDLWRSLSLWTSDDGKGSPAVVSGSSEDKGNGDGDRVRLILFDHLNLVLYLQTDGGGGGHVAAFPLRVPLVPELLDCGRVRALCPSESFSMAESGGDGQQTALRVCSLANELLRETATTSEKSDTAPTGYAPIVTEFLLPLLAGATLVEGGPEAAAPSPFVSVEKKLCEVPTAVEGGGRGSRPPRGMQHLSKSLRRPPVYFAVKQAIHLFLVNRSASKGKGGDWREGDAVFKAVQLLLHLRVLTGWGEVREDDEKEDEGKDGVGNEDGNNKEGRDGEDETEGDGDGMEEAEEEENSVESGDSQKEGEESSEEGSIGVRSEENESEKEEEEEKEGASVGDSEKEKRTRRGKRSSNDSFGPIAEYEDSDFILWCLRKTARRAKKLQDTLDIMLRDQPEGAPASPVILFLKLAIRSAREAVQLSFSSRLERHRTIVQHLRCGADKPCCSGLGEEEGDGTCEGGDFARVFLSLQDIRRSVRHSLDASRPSLTSILQRKQGSAWELLPLPSAGRRVFRWSSAATQQGKGEEQEGAGESLAGETSAFLSASLAALRRLSAGVLGGGRASSASSGGGLVGMMFENAVDLENLVLSTLWPLRKVPFVLQHVVSEGPRALLLLASHYIEISCMAYGTVKGAASEKSNAKGGGARRDIGSNAWGSSEGGEESSNVPVDSLGVSRRNLVLFLLVALLDVLACLETPLLREHSCGMAACLKTAAIRQGLLHDGRLLRTLAELEWYVTEQRDGKAAHPSDILSEPFVSSAQEAGVGAWGGGLGVVDPADHVPAAQVGAMSYVLSPAVRAAQRSQEARELRNTVRAQAAQALADATQELEREVARLRAAEARLDSEKQALERSREAENEQISNLERLRRRLQETSVGPQTGTAGVLSAERVLETCEWRAQEETAQERLRLAQKETERLRRNVRTMEVAVDGLKNQRISVSTSPLPVPESPPEWAVVFELLLPAAWGTARDGLLLLRETLGVVRPSGKAPEGRHSHCHRWTSSPMLHDHLRDGRQEGRVFLSCSRPVVGRNEIVLSHAAESFSNEATTLEMPPAPVCCRMAADGVFLRDRLTLPLASSPQGVREGVPLLPVESPAAYRSFQWALEARGEGGEGQRGRTENAAVCRVATAAPSVGVCIPSLRAFASLRAEGGGIALHALAAGLESNSICLETQAVCALVMQCVWEAGPPVGGGLEGRGKECRRDFLWSLQADSAFGMRLTSQIVRALRERSENWGEPSLLLSLSALLLRLVAASEDSKVGRKAAEAVREVRTVAEKWVMAAQRRLASMAEATDEEVLAVKSQLRLCAVGLASSFFEQSRCLQSHGLFNDSEAAAQWLFALAVARDASLTSPVALSQTAASKGRTGKGKEKETGGPKTGGVWDFHLDRMVHYWGLQHEQLVHQIASGEKADEADRGAVGTEDAKGESLLSVVVRKVWAEAAGVEGGQLKGWKREAGDLDRWYSLDLPLSSPSESEEKENLASSKGSEVGVRLSLDIVGGRFLVGGAPPGVLPSSIRSHPVFQRVFGNARLEVWPAAGRAGFFSTKNAVRGAFYSFGLESGNKLSVIETVDRDLWGGTRESELVAHDAFRGDLPDVFVDGFSHWVDKQKRCVEFRPVSFEDPEFAPRRDKLRPFYLHLDNGRMWEASVEGVHSPEEVDRWMSALEEASLSGGRLLADIRGKAVQKVRLGVFNRLTEDAGALHLWVPSEAVQRSGTGGEGDGVVACTVDLPPLDVSFTVEVPAERSEKLPVKITPDDFPGWVVAERQCPGTLYRLRHRLLLRPQQKQIKQFGKGEEGKEGEGELNVLRERTEALLLVPFGEVVIGTPQEVLEGSDWERSETRIVPLGDGAEACGASPLMVFHLDSRLKRPISRPLCPVAELFLCLLLASCSSPFPDAFTGLPASSLALQILQCAAVWSCHPRSKAEARVLSALSKLSPVRSRVCASNLLPLPSNENFSASAASAVGDTSPVGHQREKRDSRGSASNDYAGASDGVVEKQEWPLFVPPSCALDAYALCVDSLLKAATLLQPLHGKGKEKESNMRAQNSQPPLPSLYPHALPGAPDRRFAERGAADALSLPFSHPDPKEHPLAQPEALRDRVAKGRCLNAHPVVSILRTEAHPARRLTELAFAVASGRSCTWVRGAYIPRSFSGFALSKKALAVQQTGKHGGDSSGVDVRLPSLSGSLSSVLPGWKRWMRSPLRKMETTAQAGDPSRLPDCKEAADRYFLSLFSISQQCTHPALWATCISALAFLNADPGLLQLLIMMKARGGDLGSLRLPDVPMSSQGGTCDPTETEIDVTALRRLCAGRTKNAKAFRREQTEPQSRERERERQEVSKTRQSLRRQADNLLKARERLSQGWSGKKAVTTVLSLLPEPEFRERLPKAESDGSNQDEWARTASSLLLERGAQLEAEEAALAEEQRGKDAEFTLVSDPKRINADHARRVEAAVDAFIEVCVAAWSPSRSSSDNSQPAPVISEALLKRHTAICPPDGSPGVLEVSEDLVDAVNSRLALWHGNRRLANFCGQVEQRLSEAAATESLARLRVLIASPATPLAQPRDLRKIRNAGTGFGLPVRTVSLRVLESADLETMKRSEGFQLAERLFCGKSDRMGSEESKCRGLLGEGKASGLGEKEERAKQTEALRELESELSTAVGGTEESEVGADFRQRLGETVEAFATLGGGGDREYEDNENEEKSVEGKSKGQDRSADDEESLCWGGNGNGCLGEDVRTQAGEGTDVSKGGGDREFWALLLRERCAVTRKIQECVCEWTEPRPGDEGGKALAAVGMWDQTAVIPSYVLLSLLDQQSESVQEEAEERCDSQLSEAVRRTLKGGLCVAWTLEDRARRLAHLAEEAKSETEEGDSQVQDDHLGVRRRLEREWLNPGHVNWRPCDWPCFLLLEVENDLLIRPAQFEVFLHMFSGGGDGSAERGPLAVQMEPGEGKTKVILPMLCSASLLTESGKCVEGGKGKGPTACIPRVTVPGPLLELCFQDLRGKLGGLLGCRVLTFPCRRDAFLDLPAVRAMRTVLDGAVCDDSFKDDEDSPKGENGVKVKSKVERRSETGGRAQMSLVKRPSIVVASPEQRQSLSLKVLDLALRAEREGGAEGGSAKQQEAGEDMQQQQKKQRQRSRRGKRENSDPAFAFVQQKEKEEEQHGVVQERNFRGGLMHVASELDGFVRTLETFARDFIDETDEVLSPRRSLVYTVGRQTGVDGGASVWDGVQSALRLARALSPSVLEKLGGAHLQMDSEFADRPWEFCSLQLTSETAWTELRARMVDVIISGHTTEGSGVFAPLLASASSATGTAISQSKLFRFLVEGALEETELSEVLGALGASQRVPALLLRGLLGFDLLFFSLRLRWRVQYGRGKGGLAVPFAAKDRPKPNTDFGHPHVSLLLTQIDRYRSGLSFDEFVQVLTLCGGKDNCSDIYAEWSRGVGEALPPELRSGGGVNLQGDLTTVKECVFPVMRKHMKVVDFFLSEVVFPVESRQFPFRLAATACELVHGLSGERGGKAPAVGFSGTNNTQALLPPPMRQRDLPRLVGTNGEMMARLLTGASGGYRSLESSSATGAEILSSVSSWLPHVNVLLDGGALVVDLDNRETAQEWLRLRPHCRAAIFFDPDSDRPLALDRHGREQPLELSPFNVSLRDCAVYLDEAHCRGTDLPFAPDSCACVTLGRGMTADKLLQTCLRLRLLARGQTVAFLASAEVDRQIPKRRLLQGGASAGLHPQKEVQSSDTEKGGNGGGPPEVLSIPAAPSEVLRWSVANLVAAVEGDLSHLVDACGTHLRKVVASSQHGDDLAAVSKSSLETEGSSLESLFGSSRQEISLLSRAQRRLEAVSTSLQLSPETIHDRLPTPPAADERDASVCVVQAEVVPQPGEGGRERERRGGGEIETRETAQSFVSHFLSRLRRFGAGVRVLGDSEGHEEEQEREMETEVEAPRPPPERLPNANPLRPHFHPAIRSLLRDRLWSDIMPPVSDHAANRYSSTYGLVPLSGALAASSVSSLFDLYPHLALKKENRKVREQEGMQRPDSRREEFCFPFPQGVFASVDFVQCAEILLGDAHKEKGSQAEGGVVKDVKKKPAGSSSASPSSPSSSSPDGLPPRSRDTFLKEPLFVAFVWERREGEGGSRTDREGTPVGEGSSSSSCRLKAVVVLSRFEVSQALDALRVPRLQQGSKEGEDGISRREVGVSVCLFAPRLQRGRSSLLFDRACALGDPLPSRIVDEVEGAGERLGVSSPAASSAVCAHSAEGGEKVWGPCLTLRGAAACLWLFGGSVFFGDEEEQTDVWEGLLTPTDSRMKAHSRCADRAFEADSREKLEYRQLLLVRARQILIARGRGASLGAEGLTHAARLLMHQRRISLS
uniref:ubiquitinyl hydrolase 1 n=1 Tax=Chromera velia CCMP2878 TaxID=1169474 RepID=A0A0G4FJ51_9ALVE|eukprot:Cvel_17236.t1-p1 / transcript=Cvel_17236.t1 / gene=Cvel_17236 / organism=Chromera_velia_CCMP2878 / gene_product=hypothetical protein / transcript_product=hypothetical protein / location=Cvel_scaffold1364:13269-41904(-) / protein_length=4559 / sequence_SO=supercontig / SO=protein_coding / is_pseudo=false